MADLGAEVVAVEPPGGSVLRSEAAYPFLARGKKSVVLDLHELADAEVAWSLASEADVLITTLRRPRWSGSGSTTRCSPWSTPGLSTAR
ncbi:CoA transferase [Actinomadura madurae]|nr:CoA transferase [Actinomadura madurae]MCP9965012.1 CoA transferase [Actinomadura madurae]